MQNIFFQYLIWQFFEAPRGILKAWGNFLKFGLNYFSTPLLLKTLFSPWRRYQWAHARGFDIGKFFDVLASNLISRILGALVRSVFILVGILTEIFIIFAGAVIFFGWLVLPAILIYGLFFGFKILI